MISIIDSVNILELPNIYGITGGVSCMSTRYMSHDHTVISKADIYNMLGFTSYIEELPNINYYTHFIGLNQGHSCGAHNAYTISMSALINAVDTDITISRSRQMFNKSKLHICFEQPDTKQALYDIYVNDKLHLSGIRYDDRIAHIKSLVVDYIRDYVEPKSIDKRLQALEDKVMHERKSFTIWDDSQHGISNHRMYSITHSSMCKEYSSDGVDNRTLHNLIGCNTSLPIKYYVIGTMSNSTGNGYAMTVGRFLSQHIMNPIIPDIVITNNKDIAYLADKLVIYIDSNSIHVNGELISTESDLNELHKKIRSIICNYIDSNSNDTMLSETDKLKAKNEELTKSLNDEKTKVAELQQKLDEMNSRINKMMAMLSGN